MEHIPTTPTLDIRTLLVLLSENEMPRDRVFNLLARECNIPVDKLINAVTVTPAVTDINRRPRIQWTDEKIATLIDLWNKGERPGQIADKMNTTTQVVYQKISQLRKTNPTIKPRTSHNPFFGAKKLEMSA
jgi:hypothetical protein